VRIFLIVLAVSIVASIVLWNFGVAASIWPAHPLLATTGLAMVIAIIIQMMLTRDKERASRKPQ